MVIAKELHEHHGRVCGEEDAADDERGLKVLEDEREDGHGDQGHVDQVPDVAKVRGDLAHETVGRLVYHLDGEREEKHKKMPE